MLLLAASLACTPPPTGHAESPVADSGTPADSAATDDSGTTPQPGDLHGTPPSEDVPAPDFVATNQDGEPRDRDALIGHPTVLWFYPAAGTFG